MESAISLGDQFLQQPQVVLARLREELAGLID